MADTKISAMTDLSPIVSTDYIPIVRSGANGKALNIQSSLGLTAGSNPATGQIGEIVSSSIASGSAVALTSGQAKEFTSITLTAGNWCVNLTGIFTGGVATAADMTLFVGTATGNNFTGQDTAKNTAYLADGAGGGTNQSGFVSWFINITGTTTYYAKAYVSGSGNSVFGNITAIRCS